MFNNITINLGACCSTPPPAMGIQVSSKSNPHQIGVAAVHWLHSAHNNYNMESE
ncbi:hypothetical protein [Pseudoduganella sp. R-34]|uniref:hypothetical protein n=1 Tax=Pseudoduganella sp. R-34 TaxID=3404062 RepID=UPI003CF44AAE